MKNEEQIQTEVRTKIMMHVRGLLKPDLFDKCFNYLVNRFYDDLNTNKMDDIEKFQVISAMFISLQKGLLDEEQFEYLAVVKKVYRILYNRALEQATSREDIEVIIMSDEYYSNQLSKIFK